MSQKLSYHAYYNQKKNNNKSKNINKSDDLIFDSTKH